MSLETQSEYFVSSITEPENKQLSVFHTPSGGGLAIPAEVLRVKSRGVPRRRQAAGKLIVMQAQGLVPADASLEPCSLEQASTQAGDFVRTYADTAVCVFEGIPGEFREAWEVVEQALITEARNSAAAFLGNDVQSSSSDAPTGMYL